MKRTMHLYETHLPVKDTEVSSRFYVDIVGLEYAHRDLTRDTVFLWIGSNKRSMLGLWGPTTSWGQPHFGHFAIAISLPALLAAGPRLIRQCGSDRARRARPSIVNRRSQ